MQLKFPSKCQLNFKATLCNFLKINSFFVIRCYTDWKSGGWCLHHPPTGGGVTEQEADWPFLFFFFTMRICRVGVKHISIPPPLLSSSMTTTCCWLAPTVFCLLRLSRAWVQTPDFFATHTKNKQMGQKFISWPHSYCRSLLFFLLYVCFIFISDMISVVRPCDRSSFLDVMDTWTLVSCKKQCSSLMT